MNIVVLGSINVDLVIETPRMPAPGETVNASAFHMIAGGKGANQAVAVARQGIPAVLIGCVGRDAFGTQQLAGLAEEGIDLDRVLRVEGLPTGVASIMVDEGSQNAIAIVAGANGAIPPSHIETAREEIKAADMLISQLEVNFDAVLTAFETACATRTPTLLNPAPARPLPDRLLEMTDFLVPNELEASALSGIDVRDRESAWSAGERLAARGAKNVLITLGEKGVAGVTRDGRFHLPAHTVRPKDTTAAGDTFIGYFATTLIKTGDIRNAAGIAQAAAALTVTQLGAQSAIPKLARVNEFLSGKDH